MQPNSEPAGNWNYRPEGGEAPTQSAADYQNSQNNQIDKPEEAVSWTASEFVSHHKDSTWYLGVGAAFIALSLVVFALTRDYISAGAIVIVFILFVIISGHKPQQRTYAVDRHGISIGEKFYPYSQFKSFAVVHEGPIGYVNFVPLKRFMPEISIYYAPEDEPRILGVLMDSLPNDQKAERLTDKFVKQIRF